MAPLAGKLASSAGRRHIHRAKSVNASTPARFAPNRGEAALQRRDAAPGFSEVPSRFQLRQAGRMVGGDDIDYAVFQPSPEILPVSGGTDGLSAFQLGGAR